MYTHIYIMSPPTVWGPPVWTLFHTLSIKLNERYYVAVGPSLFNLIKIICKQLPCPYCAEDATKFLNKINVQKLKEKQDLVNLLYIFHNYVNKKKNKPFFNSQDVTDRYKNLNLVNIVNNFIRVYGNNSGNMRTISDSFQRQIIIKELKRWLKKNIRVFM